MTAPQTPPRCSGPRPLNSGSRSRSCSDPGCSPTRSSSTTSSSQSSPLRPSSSSIHSTESNDSLRPFSSSAPIHNKPSYRSHLSNGIIRPLPKIPRVHRSALTVHTQTRRLPVPPHSDQHLDSHTAPSPESRMMTVPVILHSPMDQEIDWDLIDEILCHFSD